MWSFFKKNRQAATDEPGLSKGGRYDQVREAENRRYLAELVNVRRPPEVQKRLLEVLKFEPNLSKKIDIVERLDRLGVDTLGWYEQRISLVKAAEQEARQRKSKRAAYFFESPAYKALSPEAKGLLRGIEPPSLLRFLTREFRRIASFGKREHLLESSFLRFRSEPDARLLVWCNDEMRLYAQTLKPSLAQLVEQGWTSLDLYSYNILACLHSLVKGWLDEAPKLVPTPSRLLWLKLGPLARSWLSITRRAGQVSQALDGLAQFLKASGAEGPEIRRQLAAAEAILDDERAGVGFGKAMLAIWMLLGRRFGTRDTLTEKLKPDLIPTKSWLAPAPILEKIQAFIQARRDEQNELVRTLHLLDEIGISEPETMSERCFNDVWCLYSEVVYIMPDAGRTAASQCKTALALDISEISERAASNLSYIMTVLLRDQILAEHTLRLEQEELERALHVMRSIRQVRERLIIPLASWEAWLSKTPGSKLPSDAETGFAQALLDVGIAAAHCGLKVQQFVAQAAGLDSLAGNLAGAAVRASSGILIEMSRELREPQVFAGITLKDALERLKAWGVALAWLLGETTVRSLVKRRSETEASLTAVEAILSRMLAYETER